MRFDVRQELLDREMAPIYGRCPCCDAEIYTETEFDEYGGLCEECWCALYDDEDEGMAADGIERADVVIGPYEDGGEYGTD